MNKEWVKIKPLISVIVPVYNGEKFIEQCIDSITNQTLKDIEILATYLDGKCVFEKK